MRTFSCECGARLFFENTRCVGCQRELGFIAERGELTSLEPRDADTYLACLDGQFYRKCRNYDERGVCNWLVAAGESEPLCQACRLNRIVPDLSDPTQRAQWAEVESAKRRLLYTINQLGLPAVPQSPEAPDGLAFDIKADTPKSHVMTGHADGLITLNLAEADPVLREKARVEMAERYRTLLGHFRHEIGHYYWDVLIRDSQWIEPYRALYGDERQDYGAALQAHYAATPGDWAEDFISAYARSHPWEDWAETWAHYLHMHDALETARHFGLTAAEATPPRGSNAKATFETMLEPWIDVTVALNAMNRSMGMPDPYPFQLTPKVIEKLTFVHQVIGASPGEPAG